MALAVSLVAPRFAQLWFALAAGSEEAARPPGVAATPTKDPVISGPAVRRRARTDRGEPDHGQGTSPDPESIVEALHREHYRSLVRLAGLLVGSLAVAEEVVQDAFVAMLGAVDRLEDPATHAAYVRSIVLNTARSRLRRRDVKRRHAPTPEPAGAPSDEGARRREDREEVAAALSSLSTRQRECVVLRFYAELTEEEIAATLGISRGAVKTHMGRGMAAMTKQLEGLQ